MNFASVLEEPIRQAAAQVCLKKGPEGVHFPTPKELQHLIDDENFEECSRLMRIAEVHICLCKVSAALFDPIRSWTLIFDRD